MFRAVQGMPAAGRAGRPVAGLARAAGLAAALCAAGTSGAGAEPGPRDVVGHAGPRGGGAAHTWTLPEGQPYLYVPVVGPELNGAVATVETGAEVGAALFQRPYFGSKDLACSLDLGVAGRPDLKWVGQVARFEPRASRIPSEPTAAPNPATGGYGSLIIYRSDLGPPPGVLLMHRRRTLGVQCPTAAHKTLYDRLFVPVGAPPEAQRCVDLAASHPRAGGEDIVVAFREAERLAFLQPAHLEDRYGSVRHAFAAVLFDGLGCRGRAVSFKSGPNAQGDLRLSAYDFRGRALSVLLAYEGGALTPYLARPAPPAVARAAEPPESAPAPAREAAAPVAPAPEPAQMAAPAPASEAEAPAPPAPTPMAAPPPAPEPPVPASETAAPEPPARAPEPEAPAIAAGEPEPAAPAPPPAPVPAPEPAPMAAPAPPPAAPAEPARSTEPPAPEPPARAAPKPEPPAPEPPARPAPGAVQQAMPIPKIVPRLAPPEAAPGGPSQTFRYPVHEIYRLNFCLNWKSDCGAPAAQAWCRAQGFAEARDWKIDENIGGLFPTIVMGESRVCAQYVCDGFLEITCVK